MAKDSGEGDLAPAVGSGATADAATPAGSAVDERIPAPSEGSAERIRQVSIVIVDAAGDPVPRAEVLWADEVSLRTLPRLRQPAHFADGLRACGEITTSNEGGVATIRMAGSHLAVHGRSGRLTGDATFSLEDDVTSCRITLVEDDFLSCVATWEDGQPAPDVPLVVCWEGTSPSGPNVVAQLELGRTDASGRLTWPGWTRTARAVAGDRGNQGRVGRVVADVLGADAAFVPVTAAGGQHIAITVPRFASVRLRIHDATGHPLDWSRLLLELGGDGGSAVRFAQVSEGRAVVPAVVGAACQWQLGADRKAHGHGRIEVPPAGDEVRLICQDIVRLVGRVHPPGEPLRLKVEPQGRAPWQCHVAATPEGTFALPVSRHDGVSHFTIVARGQETVVGVPPLDAEQIDLGVVVLDSRAFAVLDVRDDLGVELQQVAIDASVEGRPVGCVAVATPGGRELRLQGAMSAAVLVVSSPGCRGEQIEVRRGERRQVVLSKEVEFDATVALLPGVDASSVWVRKPRRWSTSRQQFVPDDQWVPLRERDGRLCAKVKGAQGERCQLQVWSIKPPAVVVDVERRLGVDGLELDARRLRTIAVHVEGSGHDYVAAIESDWLSEGWLGMVRLPFGSDRWTLPADERAVVLAAAGAVPLRVPVAGAAVRVRLDTAPLEGVLGLADATELVGVAPSVRARRVRTFSGATPTAFQISSLAEVAKQVTLPIDHVVVVGGVQRAARWHGTGWLIE